MGGTADDPPGPGRYRFGDIVVDEAAHTLLRAGEPQALEPKAFAVLLALLRRPGELIGRDDLLDQVWGHRHVTPGVLTRAIAQLRGVLGDDPQNPRYIQTRHALGYSFVGELLRENEAGVATDAQPVAGNAGDVGNVADDAADSPAPGPIGGEQGARAHGQHPHRWWPHHWMAASLVAIVLLAFVVWNDDKKPSLPAEPSIAVMPFANLGGNRDDDYFAEGLAVEMHDALAGVRGLKVAAQMSPAAAMTRETDVRALGRRLGVAAVLDASVRREGQRVRINARLSDATTGFTLWSRSYDRELADVFATQGEIARDVVGSLAPLLPGTDEALAKRLAPTKSVVAFDAYLKGMQQLLRSDGSGHEDRAIGFFSQALEADASFARAQAGICRSEASKFETRRDADAFGRAEAACARAQAMDPGLGEVNLALAEMHHVRGDYGKAIEYYAKAETDPARRPAVYVGMASVHADQGREDQSRQYFARAHALRPGDPTIHAISGYYRYLAGDIPAAIASYRKAIELQPDNADLWNMLGLMHLYGGDTASASRALEKSVAIKPNYAALSNLGELKYQVGEYAAAAALHRRATALEPNDFLPWGNLGDALLADPATAAEARTAFSRAAERAQSYVDIKAGDAKALAALGWYRANLGQTGQARELITRSEALGSEPMEVAFFNAQTFVVLGDIDHARQRVAAARKAGVPEERIATNAILRRAGMVSPVATSDEADSTAPSESEGHPPGE